MSLAFVSENLLTVNHLDQQKLADVLGLLSERRLDYADLYFQSSYHEAWILEDRIIKDGSYNIDQGVGVERLVVKKPVSRMRIKSIYLRYNKVHMQHEVLFLSVAMARLRS